MIVLCNGAVMYGTIVHRIPMYGYERAPYSEVLLVAVVGSHLSFGPSLGPRPPHLSAALCPLSLSVPGCFSLIAPSHGVFLNPQSRLEKTPAGCHLRAVWVGTAFVPGYQLAITPFISPCPFCVTHGPRAVTTVQFQCSARYVEGRVNQQTTPQDLNSIDKRMKKRTKNEREVKPNPRWGDDKQLHGADEL